MNYRPTLAFLVAGFLLAAPAAHAKSAAPTATSEPGLTVEMHIAPEDNLVVYNFTQDGEHVTLQIDTTYLASQDIIHGLINEVAFTVSDVSKSSVSVNFTSGDPSSLDTLQLMGILSQMDSVAESTQTSREETPCGDQCGDSRNEMLQDIAGCTFALVGLVGLNAVSPVAQAVFFIVVSVAGSQLSCISMAQAITDYADCTETCAEENTPEEQQNEPEATPEPENEEEQHHDPTPEPETEPEPDQPIPAPYPDPYDDPYEDPYDDVEWTCWTDCTEYCVEVCDDWDTDCLARAVFNNRPSHSGKEKECNTYCETVGWK